MRGVGDPKMKLSKIFSIRSRPLFYLLVFGLAVFSVGTWWSVKSAINGDIRSRLESEADRIAATFESRMDTYGRTLYHVRAHLLTLKQSDPTVERRLLKSYLQSLDLNERFRGIKQIGFKDSRVIFDRDEPAMSVEGSDLVVSLPVPQSGTGFGSHSTSRGVVYASFNISDIFNAALGSPSLSRENVNFTLELIDPAARGGVRPIYNRFDTDSERISNEFDILSLYAERSFKLFGHPFKVSVSPLPHFFSKTDQYLPATVAFGAAFISILILLILKASQNQLLYETHAKEVSLRAAEQNRAQSTLLNRLSEAAKTLAMELDYETQGNKLLQYATLMTRSQVSALYLAALTDSTEAANLPLLAAHGLENNSSLKKRFTGQESLAMIPNGYLLRKGETEGFSSDPLLKLFTSVPAQFSDWLLIGIASRDLGRCGLLFTGRTDGSTYQPMEIEILTSLIAQAASTLENANLFRHVDDANKAKNAFLANMSHEIRTPLNAVIGFSEMLLKHNLADNQKHTLARNIRRGGEELTRIIDDILDLSKVENGRLLIVNRLVSLPVFVNDLHSTMLTRALEKGLSFKIETTGDLPLSIKNDDIRLKKVLLKLVGNAIKFTHQGSVTLHLRHLVTDEGENQLAFRIEDTGIGIDEKAQKHLFHPFVQADESPTRKYGGPGLGLALSKKLCKELGGDLHLLESLPGRGSKFEARINIGSLTSSSWTQERSPVLDFDSVERSAAAALPRIPAERIRADRLGDGDGTKALSGSRLLIVEDSEDNQEIFRFFLENAGAHVDIVASGLDAVKSATTNDFDMILMDIQIPEIDGKEATRRIRHFGYSRPIVALTAHAMHEERISVLEAGCDGQITKPVSGENLVAEVAEYLRRDHEHGPAYS